MKWEKIKFFFADLWCRIYHSYGKRQWDYIKKCEREVDEAKARMRRYEKKYPRYLEGERYVEHMKLQLAYGEAVNRYCASTGYYEGSSSPFGGMTYADGAKSKLNSDIMHILLKQQIAAEEKRLKEKKGQTHVDA